MSKKGMRRQRSRSFFSVFFSSARARAVCRKRKKALVALKRVFDPRAYRPTKHLPLTFEVELEPSVTCRTRDKRPVAPDEAAA